MTLLHFSVEHVGSKTAVQIRSHAQKFFDKVERTKDTGTEAEEEGESMCA